MIFKDLIATTKAMQDLQKKIEIYNNREVQAKNDNKYYLLLMQANKLVDTAEYIYTQLNIAKDEAIIQKIIDLFNHFENIIEIKIVLKDDVDRVNELFISIQNDMRKKWTKHYYELTNNTISTLKAIHNIDPNNVDICLHKIQQAKSWNLDVNKYKDMKAGLEYAVKLIMDLGLDEEIINFLQNTNSGKATLYDLNDHVLAWIRGENLERKIMISFKGSY